MSRAVIGRWGKNLAIRFPADIAKAAGLRDGQRVEIVSSAEEIVIRKLPAELTAETMFAGKSPRVGPMIRGRIKAASASPSAVDCHARESGHPDS
jgi:antitoxin component of MazEF toxin-antitoxin module